jgi:hypothetical protein
MKPLSNHAFRHSNALIVLSARLFLSGVMSFFVEEKTRSHSHEITGQDNVSKAHWRIERYEAVDHYVIGLKFSVSSVVAPSPLVPLIY